MTEQKTISPPAPPAIEATKPPTRGGGGWLAFAAVAWLIITLASLRRAFSANVAEVAIHIAATSLLQLVLAAMLVGGSVALWAISQISLRRPAELSTAARIGAGAGAGLVMGAIASGAALIGYGMPLSATGVLVLALGIAGTIGGALSAIHPGAANAGVTATLVAVVFFNVVSYFSAPLWRAFGGNEAANGYLAFSQAFIAGLLCGFIAYFKLRGKGHGAVAHLIAGGTSGLVWIIGDVLTRVGAARLLTLASDDTTGDRLIQEALGNSRVNTGLVLFFVGGITAMIAFGRSIPRKPAA